MKKIILIAILAISLVSCEENREPLDAYVGYKVIQKNESSKGSENFFEMSLKHPTSKDVIEIETFEYYYRKVSTGTIISEAHL